MPLPRAFQFSATSLQDYVDCPRRFQLRYLLQVAWPAPKAEPVEEQERHARLARDFHQLIHQHLVGIPTDSLSASIYDPDLERWWQAYLEYAPTLGNARVMPEVSLSTPVSGHRVLAQYDAILVRNQRSPDDEKTDGPTSTDRPAMLIIDWKTYRQRPLRAWLARRLQTRVYPVILVQAGASLLNQTRVEPDDIQMCYWLAEYPGTPETFPYDRSTFQSDLEYLSALVVEITKRIGDSELIAGTASTSVSHDIWPLTSDLGQCRYCNFRSLCGRGGVAGSLPGYEDENFLDDKTVDGSGLDFDLDWGQVQEIVY